MMSVSPDPRQKSFLSIHQPQRCIKSCFTTYFCETISWNCTSFPIFPTSISCWTLTACIISQGGLHAVMIIGGLRNGGRKSTISGLLSGRHAGFDVAQQSTNPLLRDRKTLRRRDSDEVSAFQSPSGVTGMPIMTPEAWRHHLKPTIIATWMKVVTDPLLPNLLMEQRKQQRATSPFSSHVFQR